MASIRLSESKRSDLRHYIYGNIFLPADHPAAVQLREATEAVQAVLKPIIDEKWPMHDMLVLKRYGLEREVRDVLVHGRNDDGGERGKWRVRLPSVRLFPSKQYSSEAPTLYIDDEAVIELVLSYRRAILSFEQAEAALRAPYQKAVAGCSTLAQLVEVWPEAKRFEQEWGVQLPATLTPAELEHIAADSARRQRESSAASVVVS